MMEKKLRMRHVKPGTEYKIIVSGDKALYRIKSKLGFEIIENPSLSMKNDGSYIPSNIAIFSIKTHNETSSGIYVSIVPMHDYNNMLYREKPKSFGLPTYVKANNK